MKNENKFKTLEAERFIEEVQRVLDEKLAKNWSEVAISSGMISQDFTDIKSGKKDLQRKILDNVSAKYPIDKDYILTGSVKYVPRNEENNGRVSANETVYNKSSSTIIPSANKDKNGVPYYDVDFMGGYDLVFNDQAVAPLFYIDFLPFNDCDCWINATGKSMGPLIAHGDIVALKKIDDWKRFLLEGEIYALTTDNGFRTIKILGAGEDQDHYTLIPYNDSGAYKPQQIPKEVITHVFRVKGNIKKFF